jgi:hypothetical protein
MPRPTQPPRLIDYLQYPRNLSWLVARQFEDSFTRDIYFVQQFPPGFNQGNARLSRTYRDRCDNSGKRLTDVCWMNMHFYDREITGSFSPAQSQPKCTEQDSKELERMLHSSMFRKTAEAIAKGHSISLLKAAEHLREFW